MVKDTIERSTTRLFEELDDTDRFNVVKSLKPKDSWILDKESERGKVEEIKNNDLPLPTSADRTQRKLLANRKGY